jgi:hypothetical protein
MKKISVRGRKNRKPKKDPHYPAAVERAKEAARRLQEAGIIDAEGRRIRKELPPEMRDGTVISPPVASEAVRGLPSSADNERLEAINRMAKTQLEDGTYDKVILPEGAEDE